MPQQQATTDHSVTRANTVKHWVLYTLDAIEADAEDDADGEEYDNQARVDGTLPRDIYEFAAGDDSIVFRNWREISSALSAMAKGGTPWEDRSRPVNRRTDATEWDEADVKYRYRLNDFGREVLLDLGVPDKLPNRRDLDEDDRSLGVKPGHEPGWWQDEEWEFYSGEWDIDDNDWIATDHPRVFFKDDSDAHFRDRGYEKLGRKLAEQFEDVTFVLTSGPYRAHDLMYQIRDPWRKVVQIDIYSPMAVSRTKEEMRRNYRHLLADLYKGLESVGDDD